MYGFIYIIPLSSSLLLEFLGVSVSYPLLQSLAKSLPHKRTLIKYCFSSCFCSLAQSFLFYLFLVVVSTTMKDISLQGENANISFSKAASISNHRGERMGVWLLSVALTIVFFNLLPGLFLVCLYLQHSGRLKVGVQFSKPTMPRIKRLP